MRIVREGCAEGTEHVDKPSSSVKAADARGGSREAKQQATNSWCQSAAVNDVEAANTQVKKEARPRCTK